MWRVTGHKHGTSAPGLQRMPGLDSYRTAWSWLRKLRRGMVRRDRDRLSGRAEVGETCAGGAEEGVQGRQTVPKTLAACLPGFVRKAVEPGTAMHADGSPSCSPLEGQGCPREVTALRAPKLAGRLLPHGHRIASLFRRWWAGTRQGAISSRHLDHCAGEFSFRFNRRKPRSGGKLFYRLVQQMAAIEPTPAS